MPNDPWASGEELATIAVGCLIAIALLLWLWPELLGG